MNKQEEIRQVNNQMLTAKCFDNIAFFMLAEGGAMGEPGCLIWILEDGSMYHGNFCYGDIDMKKVQELFPTLAGCSFGIFGLKSKVPEGWNYISLGMGNHLIINDKFFNEFHEQVKNCTSEVEVYNKWFDIACKLIKEK